MNFAFRGYATEKSHLKELDKKEEIALKEAIIQLQSEGKTQREIGKELGISASNVCHILKK